MVSIPIDQPMKRSNTPSKKTISDCQQSRSAFIDLIILIVVICACGFLIYPYLILLRSKTLEILEPIICSIQEEVLNAPMLYGFLALTILTISMGVLAITSSPNHKCGKPDCRGLQKPAEFDIQLETEDCVKNSNLNSDLNSSKCGLKKGLFELPREYCRELEAELKKMAPANGRAVLVFRARCGCSVGRMEVYGPKKNRRKIKK